MKAAIFAILQRHVIVSRSYSDFVDATRVGRIQLGAKLNDNGVFGSVTTVNVGAMGPGVNLDWSIHYRDVTLRSMMASELAWQARTAISSRYGDGWDAAANSRLRPLDAAPAWLTVLMGDLGYADQVSLGA